MSQWALGRHESAELQLLLRHSRSSVRDAQSNVPSAHTAQLVPLQPLGHSCVVSQRRSPLQRCTPRSEQRSAPGEHSRHSPCSQRPRHAIGALHSALAPHSRASFDPMHSRVPTLHAAQRSPLQPSSHAASSCQVPSALQASWLFALQRVAPSRHDRQSPALQPCSQRSGACVRPPSLQLLASVLSALQARVPGTHSLHTPALQPSSHTLAALQRPSPPHTWSCARSRQAAAFGWHSLQRPATQLKAQVSTSDQRLCSVHVRRVFAVTHSVAPGWHAPQRVSPDSQTDASSSAISPEPVAIGSGPRPASTGWGWGCGSGRLVVGRASTAVELVGEVSRKHPSVDAIHAHNTQHSARP
jgi:hypothetical protein